MVEGVRDETSNATVRQLIVDGLATPQPGPQLAAVEARWCPRLLYGGARGGGKSYYLLMDYLQDVPTYGEGWQGIYVRKTYPELEQAIRDSHALFPQTGATFFKQPKEWRWPNGATLRFRNLDTVESAEAYQGHSYQWFGGDEFGNYASAEVYLRMLATLRSGNKPVPTRARITANPGGPGHHWIKQLFIDPVPTGFIPFIPPGQKLEHLFIPSRISDNKLLLRNDPTYIENLKSQASKELVRAWLLGDWDVQISSFFPEFSKDRHVVEPFNVPAHWYRFRTFDWGSAHPFAVLWWTVSDGTPIILRNGRERVFPRGALICYREWYGMQPGKPNVGLRLRNDDIVRGIIGRTHPDEKIGFTATDSLPFQDHGGISIAESFLRGGVALKRGDTTRVAGWQQLRSRLVGTASSGAYPLIYFTADCVHTIRTLPALQADKHDLEDVDSNMEDHAPDAVRLACMERPIVREKRVPAQFKSLEELTFNELLESHGL